MKKSYFVILSILVLIFAFESSFSQKKLKYEKPKKFEIGLHYSAGSASSYYDLKDSMHTHGSQLILMSDENGNFIGDTTINYTYDFKAKTIALEAKYKPIQDLQLSMFLPLSFYSLNEKYFSDEAGVRYDKRNLSLTRLDYIELGSKYSFPLKDIITEFLASLRIPSGGEIGQADTSRFLSDGKFEFLAGTNFGFKTKTFSWENEIIYNYRAEDFHDQILYNSYVNFSTVPNTQFTLFFLTKFSLDSFSGARGITPGLEVLQEKNFAAGAEFQMFVTEDILARINYNVTLYGKNTWNSGIFNLYLGYRF